jgi:hypothetical protein
MVFAHSFYPEAWFFPEWAVESPTHHIGCSTLKVGFKVITSYILFFLLAYTRKIKLYSQKKKDGYVASYHWRCILSVIF